MVLEELDRCAEENAVLSVAFPSDLRDRLDQATAGRRDQLERAAHGGPSDAESTVPLVDEDAGDAPGRLFVVSGHTVWRGVGGGFLSTQARDGPILVAQGPASRVDAS